MHAQMPLQRNSALQLTAEGICTRGGMDAVTSLNALCQSKPLATEQRDHALEPRQFNSECNPVCPSSHFPCYQSTGAAGLSAAAALRVATQGQKSVHIFEKTAMTARGAAILVGVNGLKALQAIDPALLDALLAKATKLEGSGAY
jgi:hypothetical protein